MSPASFKLTIVPMHNLHHRIFIYYGYNRGIIYSDFGGEGEDDGVGIFVEESMW